MSPHRRLRRFLLFAALAMIVAGLFWWTLRSRGDASAYTTGRAVTADAPPAGDEEPTLAYERFATTNRALPDEDAAARYLAEGLRRLAGALGTRGIGDLELQVNLRAAAEHLLLDPDSTANASIVREQLISVADALGTTRPGQLEALRQSAAAVVADGPLTKQIPALRQFFRISADTLTNRRQPATSDTVSPPP